MTSSPVVQPEALGAAIRQIPLEQLEASRSNPRRTMHEADLKELAASIRQHGIQVPLLVRPAPGTEWNVRGNGSGPEDFEIICGHRRSEAATLAGLTEVPCIVRELSDHEAVEIGLIDNLQRVDVPALEEAEAFAALLAVPGSTAESIAAKLGKAPSYIGRRLKLLDATQLVRDALKAGAIEVGHALELARLDEDQQKQFLEWLGVGFSFEEDDEDDDENGEKDSVEVFTPGECRYCHCTEDDACDTDDGPCHWIDPEQTVCSDEDCLRDHQHVTKVITWRPTRFSLANLKSQVARTSLKVLTSAPFPLDADIPPIACANCPKRSGNAALLFDDCAQDTCTDRACFDKKVKVWIRAELQRADREKQPLVMLRSGYYSGDDFKGGVHVHEVHVLPDMSPVLTTCASVEHAIYINGDKMGQQTTICRDSKCKTHESESSSGSSSSSRSRGGGISKADEAKEKAERANKLAKLNAETKYRAELFAAVAKAPINPLYASDLNLEVCLYAIGRGPGQYEKKVAEALGWPEGIFGWNGSKALRERVMALPPVERLRIALLAAHAGELAVNEYSLDSKPVDLEKLAGLLGVDAKAIRAGKPAVKQPAAKPEKKAAETKPTKAAKPAKKPAAKPAKKAVLSAEARKRIAAAQKMRWAKAVKKGGK
jgi:ParB/RepB/Spo0J family partition protein